MERKQRLLPETGWLKGEGSTVPFSTSREENDDDDDDEW